jgi:hypothetical protein
LNDGVILIHSGGTSFVCPGDPMTCNADIDPLGITTPLNAVWGTSSSDFWVAGDGGVLLHYAGGVYTNHSAPTSLDLVAVHGTSNSDVWVGGKSGFFGRLHGTTWFAYSGFGPEAVTALWSPRPTWAYVSFNLGELIAVDTDNGFNTVGLPLTHGGITAISGTSTNSVWAAVGRSLYRGTR